MHVHCDAYALNLVVCDSCTKKFAVVLRESYKPCESAPHEISNLTPIKRYEITVFNSVYDTALQRLENRFAGQKKLYVDLSLLFPSMFSEISKTLPNDALHD